MVNPLVQTNKVGKSQGGTSVLVLRGWFTCCVLL